MRRFTERPKQLLENMTNSDSGQETKAKMVWPCFKVFWFRAQLKEKEKEADIRSWKTTSKSVQEWTLPAQLVQLKTGQNGKGFLRIHLWCSDDLPRL